MKTVTVAAPLCAPSRLLVEAQVRGRMSRYGYLNLGVHAKEKKGHWEIDVRFTDAAAEWGEYNLLRHNYELISAPINPRNIVNAHRYTGGAWCEAGCQNKPHGARISTHAAPPPAWKDHPTRKPKATRSRGLLGILEDLLR